MGCMGVVTKKKLERMLAYWQVERGFRLTAAEVAMIVIDRNRLIQGRQLGIDKEMMVPGGFMRR